MMLELLCAPQCNPHGLIAYIRKCIKVCNEIHESELVCVCTVVR